MIDFHSDVQLFARPLGVLDHLKLSFFQLLSFQLYFLQLSTLFLSTFWSRAGRPWGPRFSKFHSSATRLGRLSAPWPHLGPIFRIFEPLERYQKIVYFLHLSQTPKIKKIIDNLAPKRQFWTKNHDFWRPFLHRCSSFF